VSSVLKPLVFFLQWIWRTFFDSSKLLSSLTMLLLPKLQLITIYRMPLVIGKSGHI
jgi:hypothetical protein